MGSLAARSQHTSVLLSWNPPLIGNIIGITYKIQYQEPRETVYFGFNVTETATELTGLKPQTTYNISVTAYTSVGAGRSTTVEIMTTPISECWHCWEPGIDLLRHAKLCSTSTYMLQSTDMISW